MTTQKAVVEMQWGLRPWHVHTQACVDLSCGNWLRVCEAVVARNWTCMYTRVGEAGAGGTRCVWPRAGATAAPVGPMADAVGRRWCPKDGSDTRDHHGAGSISEPVTLGRSGEQCGLGAAGPPVVPCGLGPWEGLWPRDGWVSACPGS